MIVCYTSGKKEVISVEKAIDLINDFQTNERIIGFMSKNYALAHKLDLMLDNIAEKLYYRGEK